MESVIAQVEDFKVIKRGEEFWWERTGEGIPGEIEFGEVIKVGEVVNDAFKASGRKKKMGNTDDAIKDDLATDSFPFTTISGIRPVQ